MTSKHLKKVNFAVTMMVVQLSGEALFAQATNVNKTNVAQLQQTQVQLQPQSQTSITSVSAEKAAAPAFSLSLGIEYAQKIAVEQEGERESSTDITLAPSYKISSILTASGNVIFSKENSGARQNSVSNTTIVLGIKGAKLTESVESLHSITGVAPTNEDSIKRDRLKGAASLTNGIRWTNPFAKVEYKLGLSKNFHEFTVNAEGNANIEYRLINSLMIAIPITDKWSISTTGAYRLGRTYKGFQRYAFEFNADINYDVLDQLSINVGTSNDGSALKSNGVDSNITAYNENSSVIRAGLTLTL